MKNIITYFNIKIKLTKISKNFVANYQKCTNCYNTKIMVEENI